MAFKLFYLFLLILLFSCSNNSEKISAPIKQEDTFIEIKPFLLGEALKSEQTQKTLITKTEAYTSTIQFVGNTKYKDEINVLIESNNTDSCYKQLTKFYNTHFNNTKTDKKFNSWSTDSLEILLFKQTDSTILANIFIKTYR